MPVYQNISGSVIILPNGKRLQNGGQINLQESAAAMYGNTLQQIHPRKTSQPEAKPSNPKIQEPPKPKPIPIPRNTIGEKYMPSRVREFQGVEVTKMKIADLWQSVPHVKDKKKHFWENLINDLEENGMENPIIAIKTDLKTVWAKKAQYKQQLCDPPGDADASESNPSHDTIMYVIWGGSNRFAILQDKGYTHVDCVIVDNDFQKAFKFQGEQRKAYNWLDKKK